MRHRRGGNWTRELAYLAHHYARKHKLLSNLAYTAGGIIHPKLGSTVGRLLERYGYGKKKSHHRSGMGMKMLVAPSRMKRRPIRSMPVGPRLLGKGRRHMHGMSLRYGLRNTYRSLPHRRAISKLSGDGRKRRRKFGGDFLGIGNFFRKKVPHFFTKTLPSAAKSVYHHAIKPAHDFVKEHRLVSKGLSLIPGVGGIVGSTVGHVAGYGRHRRRRMMGGSSGRARLVGYGRRRVRRGRGAVHQYTGTRYQHPQSRSNIFRVHSGVPGAQRSRSTALSSHLQGLPAANRAIHGYITGRRHVGNGRRRGRGATTAMYVRRIRRGGSKVSSGMSKASMYGGNRNLVGRLFLV